MRIAPLGLVRRSDTLESPPRTPRPFLASGSRNRTWPPRSFRSPASNDAWYTVPFAFVISIAKLSWVGSSVTLAGNPVTTVRRSGRPSMKRIWSAHEWVHTPGGTTDVPVGAGVGVGDGVGGTNGVNVAIGVGVGVGVADGVGEGV